ncbi:hypothetical protein DAEQUDRAFT_81008 [Daedalea quercina L-15889]|uniref:Uncharacterized protein n=1 Tax=Daedalea quercina L-15889 TaxID=1314783 RepID=A0A165SGX7_9APHY|nr:hypothetical protein DAEQUDRAFT_81008 [Daedalea quercina L-15889]
MGGELRSCSSSGSSNSSSVHLRCRRNAFGEPLGLFCAYPPFISLVRLHDPLTEPMNSVSSQARSPTEMCRVDTAVEAIMADYRLGSDLLRNRKQPTSNHCVQWVVQMTRTKALFSGRKRPEVENALHPLSSPRLGRNRCDEPIINDWRRSTRYLLLVKHALIGRAQ